MEFRRLAWSLPVACVGDIAELAPTLTRWAVVARPVLFVGVT